MKTIHSLEDPTVEYKHIATHFNGNPSLGILGEGPQLMDLRVVEEASFDNTTAVDDEKDFVTDQDTSPEDLAFLDLEVEAEESREQDSRDLIRFQYDGMLKPTLFISRDGKGHECSTTNYKFIDKHEQLVHGIPGGWDCHSFHVLSSLERYNWRLDLEYEILPEDNGNVYCDIVSENMAVSMENHLGLSNADAAEWAGYGALTESQLEELSRCGDGCRLTIQHDKNNVTEHKSNARAVDMVPEAADPRKLRAGPPNKLNDEGFLKFVAFSYPKYENEYDQHRACVLISGVYARNETDSVPLPTHKPLLVIYDPPGGMSYSSYQVRIFRRMF